MSEKNRDQKAREDRTPGKLDVEPSRRYREAAVEHARSGRVEEEAERARRDLEGPEGEELRRAESEGRAKAADEDPELECVSEKLRW